MLPIIFPELPSVSLFAGYSPSTKLAPLLAQAGDHFKSTQFPATDFHAV